MGDIVILKTFEHAVEAEMCKALLADNGINSAVFDDIMNTTYPPQLIPVRLMVAAEDYEQANTVLEAKFSKEE